MAELDENRGGRRGAKNDDLEPNLKRARRTTGLPFTPREAQPIQYQVGLPPTRAFLSLLWSKSGLANIQPFFWAYCGEIGYQNSDGDHPQN